VFFSIKAGEIKNGYIKIYNEYSQGVISAPQLRNPEIEVPATGSDAMSALSGGVFVFSILSFFFFLFVKEKHTCFLVFIPCFYPCTTL
jgi:hypothetical protein